MKLMENTFNFKRIETDKDAEKCLLSIKEIKADYTRQVNCCKEMIAEYQEKIKRLEEKQGNALMPFESQLQEYFGRIERKVTQTQESYKLPHGKLKLKQKPPEIKKDEAKLLKYCKQAARTEEFIQTKESVIWAELKKELTFKSGCAIDKNGEIVPGIELIEREPEFIVEVD